MSTRLVSLSWGEIVPADDELVVVVYVFDDIPDYCRRRSTRKRVGKLARFMGRELKWWVIEYAEDELQGLDLVTSRNRGKTRCKRGSSELYAIIPCKRCTIGLSSAVPIRMSLTSRRVLEQAQHLVEFPAHSILLRLSFSRGECC